MALSSIAHIIVIVANIIVGYCCYGPIVDIITLNIHPRHSSVWRFSHHQDLCPVLILQNIWRWLRCRKTGRLAANYERTQCEAWWWVVQCTQAAHTLDSQPAVLQRCLRYIAYDTVSDVVESEVHQCQQNSDA